MKSYQLILIWLIILSITTGNSGSQNSRNYKDARLYCSLAGSGDPWSSLSRLRMRIMLGLHDGLNAGQIARIFKMTPEQIETEIKPLREAGLVKKINGLEKPTFFIANQAEVEQVYAHSRQTGLLLAEAIMARRDRLEKTFSSLTLSRSHSLKELGFMLIGSRILDIGVLSALARDRSLLTPAPHRPGPTRPDARYYFYMVEGKTEYLGKLGQDDTDLKWPNWHLFNFGQSWINGKPNPARKEFEIHSGRTLKSGKDSTPEALAGSLGVHFLNRRDSDIWSRETEKTSHFLFKILKNRESGFRSFYSTLNSSRYTHNSFGEFFCWYYHLAYVWAIEALAEQGMIKIPAELYSAVIMYKQGPEGLLSR